MEFEYLGYHFVPVKRIRNMDFYKIMTYAKSDWELGFSTYEWRKHNYTCDGFYIASGDSPIDLFRCIENGKVYVPALNEMFLWTGKV